MAPSREKGASKAAASAACGSGKSAILFLLGLLRGPGVSSSPRGRVLCTCKNCRSFTLFRRKKNPYTHSLLLISMAKGPYPTIAKQPPPPPSEYKKMNKQELMDSVAPTADSC